MFFLSSFQLFWVPFNFVFGPHWKQLFLLFMFFQCYVLSCFILSCRGNELPKRYLLRSLQFSSVSSCGTIDGLLVIDPLSSFSGEQPITLVCCRTQGSSALNGSVLILKCSWCAVRECFAFFLNEIKVFIIIIIIINNLFLKRIFLTPKCALQCQIYYNLYTKKCKKS